jgi:hypothetical protein
MIHPIQVLKLSPIFINRAEKRNRTAWMVEMLFNEILEKAYDLKIGTPDPRLEKLGLIYWNAICSVMSPPGHIKLDLLEPGIATPSMMAWNPTILPGGKLYTAYQHVLSSISTTAENNHFLTQIRDIPSKYPPDFVRLMQIALNIGQISSVINSMPNTENLILERSILEKLTCIETYITKENYVQFPITEPLYEHFSIKLSLVYEKMLHEAVRRIERQ